jgi:hypothetical protein
MVFVPAKYSYCDVNVGISADSDGIKAFHLAIGDFYRVPEKEVYVVKKRGLTDDEIPVVFHLAKRANVSPSVIIDMRIGGKSWMDISLHYGLTAEIFFVEVKTVNGPPYGRALGHYKKKNRKDWGTIKLADNDIINLVNLKFLSKHYGHSPEEIIKMKSNGTSFAKINHKVKNAKASKKSGNKAKSSKSKSKGKKKRK